MEKRKQLIFLEDSKGIVKTKNKNGHLYVLSNDEIKESDYCYSYKTNKIVKSTCDVSREANKNIGFWKKVIATTDTSLYIHQKETISLPERVFYLPQPSQQFIQKFVEEYNKGNVITDVLVEYELKITHDGRINNNTKMWEELKINPKDNTITIKQVKKSWNKEEVK